MFITINWSFSLPSTTKLGGLTELDPFHSLKLDQLSEDNCQSHSDQAGMAILHFPDPAKFIHRFPQTLSFSLSKF